MPLSTAWIPTRLRFQESKLAQEQAVSWCRVGDMGTAKTLRKQALLSEVDKVEFLLVQAGSSEARG